MYKVELSTTNTLNSQAQLCGASESSIIIHPPLHTKTKLLVVMVLDFSSMRILKYRFESSIDLKKKRPIGKESFTN